MAWGRQSDATLAVQAAQHFLRMRQLEFAASVDKAEFAAHVAGERGAAGVTGLCQQRLQGRDGCSDGQVLPNATFVEHASDMPQRPEHR